MQGCENIFHKNATMEMMVRQGVRFPEPEFFRLPVRYPGIAPLPTLTAQSVIELTHFSIIDILSRL